jgi:glutathione peroxidase
MPAIYDFEVTTIDGVRERLDVFRGKTLLIVNVASRCGYTSQYRGLEALYRRHEASGFVVLGFPCDQFARQEPGTEAEIQEFCSENYHVTFPMFSKIKVNGADAHPLYKFLKSQKKGIFGLAGIKWNFAKFLVDRNGVVVRRYGSRHTPEDIEPDVIAALEAAPSSVARR